MADDVRQHAQQAATHLASLGAASGWYLGTPGAYRCVATLDTGTTKALQLVADESDAATLFWFCSFCGQGVTGLPSSLSHHKTRDGTHEANAVAAANRLLAPAAVRGARAHAITFYFVACHENTASLHFFSDAACARPPPPER
jgi:hypothetical protein